VYDGYYGGSYLIMCYPEQTPGNLYEGQPLQDYTVKVDVTKFSATSNTKIQAYVYTRINGTQWAGAYGAVQNGYLALALLDSSTYPTTIASASSSIVYDANYPATITCTVIGDAIVAKISHKGQVFTQSGNTTIINTGHPAFGGRNQYGYCGGNFDNFVVTTPGDVCGALGMVYLEGDVNKDCYVNMLDIAVLGEDWLKCSDPANSSCDQYWK
jgi:hypothetical protein